MQIRNEFQRLIDKNNKVRQPNHIKHQFYPMVINDSDLIFKESKNKLFNKGLVHNVYDNKPNTITYELCSLWIRLYYILPKEKQNLTWFLIKDKIAKVLKNDHGDYSKNCYLIIPNSIKTILTQHDLLTVKDKHFCNNKMGKLQQQGEGFH